MKKAFLNLLVFFICSTSFIQAQSSLGIDATNYTIPSTVNFNASYTFLVHVKNYGPQPYNGSVNVNFASDSASNNSLSPLTTGTVTSSIAVNSEVLDSLSILIGPSFRSGINTVVIWPKNTSADFITHDTLRVQIAVVGRSGIKNYTESKPLVFPNPMQSNLFVANKDPNFIIEHVRIFDTSGQLIYSEKFKGNIDVSKLVSGIYTLEFADAKGNLSRYKVVKE